MAEIGIVLMPADIAVLARILHPGGVLIQHDIGADQVLDDVEDGGICRKPIREGLAEIDLRARDASQRPTHSGFELLEFAPQFGGIALGEHTNREKKAVALEL